MSVLTLFTVQPVKASSRSTFLMPAPLFTSMYVKVEHLQPDPNTPYKEGYVPDAGLQAVPINIQPASPEMTALNEGAYGKAYTVFTTTSGILESDRITTVSGAQSVAYIVKGRQNFDFGLGQHAELYVEGAAS